MPKNKGYSYTAINQLGSETASNAVGTYIGKVKLGSGDSGPALDAKFRKPFPNMGDTKTGREK